MFFLFYYKYKLSTDLLHEVGNEEHKLDDRTYRFGYWRLKAEIEKSRGHMSAGKFMATK